VDHLVEYWPSGCARCGQALAADPLLEAAVPGRYQVTELPRLRAEVTEHRVHHLRCPRCGHTSAATLPPGVARGTFGPRLQATVALLSGRYRLSRREVADLCGDLLGTPLAVGSVDHLCQATGAALAEPVAQLERAVQDAAIANVDETGWKRAGQRGWLWVVVTAIATVFTIARSRGSPVVKGLLGEGFLGYLGSDLWSAYSWVPAERRQLCWAHVRRDFQALVDYGGAAVMVGKLGLILTDRLFVAWHRARDDPAARARFAQEIGPLQAEFCALLEVGTQNPGDKAAGLCRQLRKLWPALWTFAAVPGVEPTNNVAERALRPAVLWRKGCFGSQSPEGERFVARMLSVAATCRQQGRSLLDYLTDAFTAAQRGLTIPSLLAGSVPA
jgi:transposase